MSYILLIESSTHVCSVALAKDNEVIAIREDFEEKSHASLLAVFVAEVLKEANILPNQLSAVCTSKGPGSYTGLRIGVSTAKGLAYALDIPLIAVGTLHAMAEGFAAQLNHTTPLQLVIPTIDARRMEVYSSVYTQHMEPLRDIEAQIITAESFTEYAAHNFIHIIGTGAAKCIPVLTSTQFHIYPDFLPSAKYMCNIAFRFFQEKKFEDVAYFEPFYLKDFIATIPRKNVLS